MTATPDAPRFDTIELHCCTDCLHLMANGETGEDDGGDARGERMAQRLGDDARHISPACGEDCEDTCGGFSLYGCGVCGDETFGERHRAVILRPIDPRVERFRAARDWYYAEGAASWEADAFGHWYVDTAGHARWATYSAAVNDWNYSASGRTYRAAHGRRRSGADGWTYGQPLPTGA